MVVRRTSTANKTEEPELGYYHCSLPPTQGCARRFGQLVRGHWAACESRNHWVRDKLLREDDTLSKNRSLNANLTSLRVAILAVKAWLLPDSSWPQVIETAQNSTSFAYQLVCNHRVK